MDFTIMTYNVGNGLVHANNLAEALRQTNADVVGLQEVNADQAHGLAARLEDVSPHPVLIPDGFAGKAVPSRFPVLSHAQLALYPARPDLVASLDVHGAPVRVVVGHPPP